ncbi:MAG TPA: carbohydrate kinase family protein [Thermoleophilaceae bacterium]|nr:carbohydrate kinase family protein [Thermoleophilaceae bacterium]
MTRLVVLGDVMVDVVCRLNGPIALGSDAPARIEFGYGGSAANVAAWAASASGVPGRTAGDPPVLAGRIGADERGVAAEGELRAAGVDPRLAVDGERPTGTCVVLVGPDGERSMVPDAGANERLAEADLPDDVLVEGAHLHLTGYSLVREGSRPAARAAIERARERGMSVSVDPSSAALLSPAFLDELSGVSLLLPNEEEAAVLTGEEDAERGAVVLAGRVPEVVVTLGRRGGLWTDGTRVSHIAGEKVAPPIDTTGAGDAFAAGFLVARLGGAAPEECLRAGCQLAAVAVRTPGARPG